MPQDKTIKVLYPTKRGATVSPRDFEIPRVEIRKDHRGKPYVVTISKDGWVDYPIRYTNGRTAYESPGRVPNYLRRLAQNALDTVTAAREMQKLDHELR